MSSQGCVVNITPVWTVHLLVVSFVAMVFGRRCKSSTLSVALAFVSGVGAAWLLQFSSFAGRVYWEENLYEPLLMGRAFRLPFEISGEDVTGLIMSWLLPIPVAVLTVHFTKKWRSQDARS